MAEIRLPVAGNSDSLWSDYMAKLLREVVNDWVRRVDAGDLKRFHYDNEPITTEHLRIAKSFLEPVFVD